MNQDSVPLYLGIPLAIMCLAASVAVITFIIWVVKGK